MKRFSGALLLGLIWWWLPAFLAAAPTPSTPAAPLSLGELQLDIDWRGWLTLGVVVLTFLVLICEVVPPHLVMFGGGVVLVLTQVITPRAFLEGFTRDIIWTLMGLFVVAHALDRSGVLTALSRWILPSTPNRTKQLLAIMAPVGIASAFLNNTPIVLMLTGTIRRWARKNQLFASRYLIPLSYAAILGGTCTLIGTSGNLVVDSLLRGQNPNAGLQFFELAWIGLPITLLGVAYLALVGFRLLPDREDPMAKLSSQAREYIGEFLVEAECPLVDMTVRQANRTHLLGVLLAEIERGQFVIDSPGPNEKIAVGDRLVVAGDIANIAALHGITGLQSAADPHFRLDLEAPHFSEVVVSVTSSLMGKTLRQADFRAKYGASVIAVYRQGWRVPGNVSDVMLHPGDTLVLLSSEPWREGATKSRDFYVVSHNEPIAPFVKWRAFFAVALLFTVVVVASLGVPMVKVALAAAIVAVVFRFVPLAQVYKGVGWSLLVLIASSFSYGMAVQTSGLANAAAHLVLAVVGREPHLLILGVFLITMLTTEVITNTAAVLLIFPVAIQAMHLAGYDSVEATKATGVVVALAASCSFLSPIGYQTNTIVYGPGGYRFGDYFKVGLFLTIMVATMVTLLVPYFWPLQ